MERLPMERRDAPEGTRDPWSRISSRAALLGLMALVVTLGVLAGCSKKKSETPDAASKATVVAPLTGLRTTDRAVSTRPALAIKIDNADPAARPQSGLNQADVVYEVRVEGSVTRFVAVFQSRGADPVGPVRSARMIDIPIVSALSDPLFAWSGANPGVSDAIRSAPLVDVGADAVPEAYQRRSTGGKTAPHDFYASTSDLWAAAPDDAKPPEPIFVFRAPDQTVPADAREIGEVHIDFGVSGGAPVDWRWNAESRRFDRWQQGTPHIDEQDEQVSASNVIIQFVDYRPNGDVDSGGSPVYEADQMGEGSCWVLTNGRLIEGSWSKPSETSLTTFTDTNGDTIALTRGRTWVALSAPDGASVTD